MQPQDFYIRAKANEGVRVTLESGDWLQIRSVWSDSYSQTAQQLREWAMSDLLMLRSADGKDAALRMDKWQRRARRARLVASLIADWSLTEQCTKSEKLLLLIRSPRLRRQIELIAENMNVGADHG